MLSTLELWNQTVIELVCVDKLPERIKSERLQSRDGAGGFRTWKNLGGDRFSGSLGVVGGL